MNAPAQQWAVTLFNHSVLKQEKFRQIAALVGDPEGKTCLDIGADNGVISYLLRQRGGDWHSADLDARTVESIRQLVGTNVYQINGEKTPFADGQFDLVVIVDFLEHIHTDREFARELRRILRPGGTLIVNVPHLKPHSVLNRVRHAIGLTDEKHGHVRPGYSVDSLREVLGADFHLEATRTYSGSFSEGVDTVLNGAYEVLSRRKDAARSAKGPVITGSDMQRHRKQFQMLRILYPTLWLLTRLDRLLFLQPGYKLIVKATAQQHTPPAAVRTAAGT